MATGKYPKEKSTKQCIKMAANPHRDEKEISVNKKHMKSE